MNEKKVKEVKAWGLKNIKTSGIVNCATPDKYEIQTMYPTCMKSGDYKVIRVSIKEIK